MQSSDHLADGILSHQRRKWFATEMQKNRGAYTQDKQLLLLTGTWNVNGRSPDPNIDISPWLFPRSRQDQKPIDVFLLGLQEIQFLSGVDAVRTDPVKGIAWRKKIQTCLGSDYERVAERQLVGIMVFVFVRKNHVPFLSNVQLSYAATGFLNAVGNKGGVAARFKLYNRTISCVACHLAAHVANVERRNQDFTDVVRKAVFLPLDSAQNSLPTRSSSVFTLPGETSQPNITRQAKTVIDESALTADPYADGLPSAIGGNASWLGSVASVAATAFYDISAGANTTILNDPRAIKAVDHDLVFWLGDLNYRIDAPLDQVMTWINKNDWDSLYRFDQLQREMKTCGAFTGFQEARIHFPPTYKLERFSNDYSCDENGTVKRVPAYTDRILWRVGVDEEDPHGVPDLNLEEYSCAHSVYSSDHRPVYALFTMTFGIEDESRRQNVEDKINKELDTREARYKPSLQFSSSLVEFGDIFFEQECERSISIRNVGGEPAIFSVEMPNSVSKWLLFDVSRWQRIEIQPDRTVSLRMRALVNAEQGMANSICITGCSLGTVLQITAQPGNMKESIRVRGRYVATTLGLPLETLSMLAEPVLSLRLSKETKSLDHLRNNVDEDHKNAPGSVPLSIPKEIWLLVDGLIRVHDGDDEPYMNRFPSLFLGEADEAQVHRALAFIDRAERMPEDLSGDAIGMCLLRVLGKMDGSVIPHYAYKRVIEAGHTEDGNAVRAVVDLLPPLNSNVFWYIIGLLCELRSIQKKEDRGKAIARVFGSVLIRRAGGASIRDERSKTSFIMAAIRFQRRTAVDGYSAIIDLTNPVTHPRILVKGNVQA